MSERSVYIITGDTEQVINSNLNQLSNMCITNDLKFKKLLYSEERKHVRAMCESVKNFITDNLEDTLLITTFSDAVLNYMGYLIYKDIVDYEKVIVKIITDEQEITCNYDNEGYLNDNYPMGYFSWIEN